MKSTSAPGAKKIKRKANLVVIEIDPQSGKLMIVYGEAFYFHKGNLLINANPLVNSTLTPLKKISVRGSVLKLMHHHSKQEEHISIYPVYEGANEVIALIQRVYESGFKADTARRDTVEILLEIDGLNIRLINTAEDKRLLLTLSRKHGNFLIRRYPEPSMRFQVDYCTITDSGLFTVECVGADLYDADNPLKDLQYSWQLDVQPELIPAVIQLIQSGVNHCLK
jgi:hypothetical protein